MSCLQESQTQNDGFTCIKIARSQSTLWKWSRRSFSIRSNMLWIDWRSVCLRWHTAKFCCLSLHVITNLLFMISNFLASRFRLCWTWCCRDFRIKSGIFWNTLKGTGIVTKSISLARELRIRDWLPAAWNVLFRRTSLRWRNDSWTSKWLFYEFTWKRALWNMNRMMNSSSSISTVADTC